jgi:hypothetical protein
VAECGPDEQAAVRLGNYFDRFEIQVPSPEGPLLSVCGFVKWQDNESNWWCCVQPSGVSLTGREDHIIRSQEGVMDVVENLYKKLKGAPEFRYAVAGFEVSEFDTFSELIGRKGMNHRPFHGLVLSRALWEELDRPAGYIQFSENTYWLPIRNEDIRV